MRRDLGGRVVDERRLRTVELPGKAARRKHAHVVLCALGMGDQERLVTRRDGQPRGNRPLRVGG